MCVGKVSVVGKTHTHCYTVLHCTALHYTALHYTTLHCTTLHCTILHYTILHYNTVWALHTGGGRGDEEHAAGAGQAVVRVVKEERVLPPRTRGSRVGRKTVLGSRRALIASALPPRTSQA
jgi:hypothetical protein